MEHIVRTLGKSPELAEYIENGYDDEGDDLEDIAEEEKSGEKTTSEDTAAYDSRASSRSYRHSKTGEDMTPEMEARLISGVRSSKRFSTASIIDVADRHLRDKTDAIAHIIRNISEQCAAAVEGLQLAHDAEVEAEELALSQARASHRQSNLSTVTASDDGHSAQGSENGDDSLLHPSGRASSIPPTPDLIHNRSSTSMSISSATTTPERSSQQYTIGTDIPTKIVEDSDEEIEGRSEAEEVLGKGGLIHRPAGARISALGGH
jgi:hypothetical protein